MYKTAIVFSFAIFVILNSLVAAIPVSPYSGKIQLLRLSEVVALNNTIPRHVTQGSYCSCGLDPDPMHVNAFDWVVEIPGQMMPSAQNTGDWGGGFLDNLRGQCGAITLWTAIPDHVPAPNTGLRTTFLTSIFCSLKKVQDAAWLASDPHDRVVLGCDWPH